MSEKNIILTGDRPTGRLHLGHYVGSLKRRVELQNSGQYDEINILIADDQALTDNADNPRKIRDNIVNVVLDYLSVGIDPTKTTICIQSALPALRASSPRRTRKAAFAAHGKTRKWLWLQLAQRSTVALG